MAETVTGRSISLQWQMLIGFVVGLTAGLVANMTASLIGNVFSFKPLKAAHKPTASIARTPFVEAAEHRRRARTGGTRGPRAGAR